MCCNKRRQRRAREATIIAAAAKLHNTTLGPKSHLSPTTSLVSGNGEHAIPIDAPPPYPAAARDVAVDEALAPSESPYDTITREWLDAGNDEKDRRPSFNAFHSFDAHQTSTRGQHVQNSQKAFAQSRWTQTLDLEARTNCLRRQCIHSSCHWRRSWLVSQTTAA